MSSRVMTGTVLPAVVLVGLPLADKVKQKTAARRYSLQQK